MYQILSLCLSFLKRALWGNRYYFSLIFQVRILKPPNNPRMRGQVLNSGWVRASEPMLLTLHSSVFNLYTQNIFSFGISKRSKWFLFIITRKFQQLSIFKGQTSQTKRLVKWWGGRNEMETEQMFLFIDESWSLLWDAYLRDFLVVTLTGGLEGPAPAVL